jgi:histidinol dehydrogenase
MTANKGESKGVRNIEVFAEASSIEKWRKQVLAGQKDTQLFAFIADEGPYLPGGEGTAPTPLTYFTAGVAL